jgi:hypothetical protein
MSERVSKFIVAAEALLLVLPVTLLFLFWAPDEFLRPLFHGFHMRRIIACLIGVALISGWWLMIAFWRGGSNALRDTHAVVWVAATCGGAAAIVAGVLLLVFQSVELLGTFVMFVFGLPLLIPFAHLLIERQKRASANTSLERTRDR